MKIKLLRELLVGPSDVTATRGGTEVDIDDVTAREFIANGLAEAVQAKKAPEPLNKMAAAPKNKGAAASQ
jgi:hypothetical protein